MGFLSSSNRFVTRVCALTALAATHSAAFQNVARHSARTSNLKATVLEDWQVQENGCVVGTVTGSPDIPDGEIISTSPLSNPSGAAPSTFVRSMSGSEYLLGTPRGARGTRPIAGVSRNNYSPMPPQQSRGSFLQTGGLLALGAGACALGITVFGGENGEMVAAEAAKDGEWTRMMPGLTDPTRETLTAREVQGLFGLWNTALLTGNPDTVAQRYAKGAVLLPTKSDIPRTDYEGIRDYFVKFLAKKPTGTILESYVQTQPNYAMDVGIYEFAFQNGQRIRARYSFLYTKEDGIWKIKHHHSSEMPETKGQVISESEVRGLFKLWNDALLTGDSDAVTRRYAKGAVLLPTVSDIPRTTYAGIKDYFDKFLAIKPDGKIIESYVSIGENWCKDVGIYEFRKGTDGSVVRARYSFVYVFEDGEWKISHHHSSLMPEKLLAQASGKA